jgi:hypothetical protein
MTVSIRAGVTFARLVYEHVRDPQDRSYTAWTASRHDLNRWAVMHEDWADHRLVYIERCRLKPGHFPTFQSIMTNIRCQEQA